MRQLTRLLVLVLMAACLLYGCKGQPEQIEQLTEQVNAIVRGGAAVENAELASVELIDTEEISQIKITFSFEENIDTIPEYTIKTLPNPYRISIEMGAEHRYPNISDIPATDEVAGIFLVDAINQGKSTLYIQLNAAMSFTAREEGAQLMIDLEATQAESTKEEHYVCINAYEEFRYADMPLGTSDLTPTICADSERMMLISKPFEQQSEAQVYLERIQKIFEEEKASKQRVARVISLKGGQRPEYIEGMYENEIFQLEPVLIDGQPQRLPEIYQGGRFLAYSSDGKRLFADAGFRENGSDKAISENLSILDARNNRTTLTSLTNIYSIEDAGFSPNGNAICILDGSGSTAKLHYYDIESKQLVSLSSSELTGVYDFTFADDSTIYALGNSIFRINIDGISFNVDIALEDAADIADISCAGGELYYAQQQTSEDVPGIYRLGDNGSSTRISDGNKLSISPDGKLIACIKDYNTEDGDVSGISLVNIQSNESKDISDTGILSGISWAPDSSILYYTVPTPEGDYPNTLMRYDIESSEGASLLGILTGEFYCMRDDTIYIVMVQRERNYTVTFGLTVS